MKLIRLLSVFVDINVLFYFTLRVSAAPMAEDSPLGLPQDETPCITLNNCPQFSSHSTSAPSNTSPASTKPPSSTSALKRSTPPPTTPEGPKATIETVDPIFYKCDKNQRGLIKEAWAEAKILSEAHYKWQPPGWFSKGAYQPAMSLYLGDDSKKDWSLFTRDGPLKMNTRRQYALHHEEDVHPWAYAYFYCNEDSVPSKPTAPKKPHCSDHPKDPKNVIMAYSFDDLGTFWWNAHYVVFCSQFFTSALLTSLKKKTEDAKKDHSIYRYMDPWRYTRATLVFHETYHWAKTVSQPGCGRDRAYEPQDVVLLAKNNGTEIAKLNAESWTQAAVAIYLQQTFNLKNPPGPAPQRSLDAGLVQDTKLEAMPDWFQPPYPDGATREIGSGGGPKPVPDGDADWVKLSSI